MIAVMTLSVFVHVVLSLIGILSGFIVVFGLLANKRLVGMTHIFLATTILTSVTGFFLPAKHFMPSHALGILSLIALMVAVVAWYSKNLAGGWRRGFAISAVIALYLNFFVLIAQSFMKVPALHELAPTGTEGPFKIAQLVALVIFLLLGIGAARNFRSA
jgi:hypothetical protein